MKRRRVDPNWQARVDVTRAGVMRVMDGIRRGEVDEVELDRLHNFLQFSLALMQLSGPEKWARAKMNAELMSYLKTKEGT